MKIFLIIALSAISLNSYSEYLSDEKVAGLSTLETFPFQALTIEEMAMAAVTAQTPEERLQQKLDYIRFVTDYEEEDKIPYEDIIPFFRILNVFEFDLELEGVRYPDFDNLFIESSNGEKIGFRFANYIKQIRLLNLRPPGSPRDRIIGHIYITDIDLKETKLTIRVRD